MDEYYDYQEGRLEKFFLGRLGRAAIIVVCSLMGYKLLFSLVTDPAQLADFRQMNDQLKSLPLFGGLYYLFSLHFLIYPLVCLSSILIGLRMRLRLCSVWLIVGGNFLFSQVMGYLLGEGVGRLVYVRDTWSFVHIVVISAVVIGFLYWRVDTKPLFLISKKTAS